MSCRFSFKLSASLLALLCGCALATSATAIEPEETPVPEQHEAVPLKPAEIFHIGKFAVTNSMLVTWIVAAGIIVFAQSATRNIQPVPDGKQNFWEWLSIGHCFAAETPT